MTTRIHNAASRLFAPVRSLFPAVARVVALVVSACVPAAAYAAVAVSERRDPISTAGAVIALLLSTGLIVWRVARLDHRMDLRLTLLEHVAEGERARVTAAVRDELNGHFDRCPQRRIVQVEQ